MLLATALALLITGCAQQTFTVQNKPAAVAPRKPSPIISSFLELGRERKLSMQPKFVAAQKMLLNRNPANIRKWIARFYYFRHLYSAGSACVLLTIIAWVPIDGDGSICLLVNILLGSFQLFLHSDQPLSEGEIIPFSGVCQSGGGCIIHAGGGGGFTLTDRLLMCNRRRPAATSSRRASFSALASANSFVYFASSAATSR